MSCSSIVLIEQTHFYKEKKMTIGIVKWFSNTKGWGFIEPEGGGEDVFVHYSVIQGTGFKTLDVGQVVSYEAKKGDKGYHASEVVKMDKYADEEVT